MEIEKLISVEEVATALGVKPKRAYELTKQNILPCVRLGRQVKFKPSAVQAFIDGGGAALPGGWRRDAR